MIKKVFGSSYTVVGLIMLLFGLIIGFLITDFPKIEFDPKLKIYEVFNLFLTLCIAISIPFIVKKTIDDQRAIKTFLGEEVKETIKCAVKIKTLISTCYYGGAITGSNKDELIKLMDELGIQIGALSEQLEISFPNESKKIVKDIKELYFNYDKYVTGDVLMGQNYNTVDAGFYRDHKTGYNKMEMNLKKAIHKIHCF